MPRLEVSQATVPAAKRRAARSARAGSVDATRSGTSPERKLVGLVSQVHSDQPCTPPSASADRIGQDRRQLSSQFAVLIKLEPGYQRPAVVRHGEQLTGFPAACHPRSGIRLR